MCYFSITFQNTAVVVPLWCRYVCASQQHRLYSGNRHQLLRTLCTTLVNPICAERFHRHYVRRTTGTTRPARQRDHNCAEYGRVRSTPRLEIVLALVVVLVSALHWHCRTGGVVLLSVPYWHYCCTGIAPELFRICCTDTAALILGLSRDDLCLPGR